MLHQLFADQVSRTPDATAVVSGGDRLTYAELDARANRLARELIGHGVGPDVPVGLFLERSLDLVVGLLGVLKAGGAYLPLDPDYPAERLSYMLADAGVAVLLGGTGAPAGEWTVLDVGAPRPGYPDTAPEVATLPHHLAYVIYTSGSTGRPKGVMVPHAGIVNRLDWMQREYRLTPQDRVLQKTPSSFDVSVWEFFWPLVTGATLVLARPGGHREPDYLARLMRDERITTVHFVPSMLAAFLAEPAAATCTGLRLVVCSGEALPAPLRDRCFDVLGVGPHNLYGPTEASVDVTFSATVRGAERVPIGRPAPGVGVRVLDAELRDVPEGELYLSGVQLARGYRGRADLTAERFVAAPSGERMYRTGDLVRWVDGELEYLGRTDSQVKIRGFRVELGEIEAVLLRHPGVVQAAVVLRPDGTLAGYVVASGDVADLGRFLALELPDHMVPAAFVVLDRLPLTPSGKLDRAALPAPMRRDRTRTAFVEPRGDEVEIARVWAEVLGLNGIGAEDDFFELGGDSLSALRVLSRLSAEAGVSLPARTLFDARTVRALTERVASAAALDTDVIEPADDTRLSFAQQRFWFFHELDPEGVEYNVHTARRLRGPLDVAALEAALAGVVARHEQLRTTIEIGEDGQATQVVHGGGAHLIVVDADESELDSLLHKEVGAPFDLRTGPVLRAQLVRLGVDDHVLVLGLHHAAVDGWSLGVILDELSAGYAGKDLPSLPVRYRDYAAWQRKAELDDRLRYWREELAGLTPLQLPTDRPRPATRGSAGSAHRFTIPAELTDSLREVGAQHGATLFMTLVAASQVLFARYSGRRDVAVGTVVSGRDRPELEPLVGCFINTLVLRSDVDADLPFADFLGQVRETSLGAFANRDVPFERLVDEVDEQRDAGRTPLVQAMVVLQNALPGELRLGDATADKVDLPSVSAIFDVSLEFTERAGGLDVMIQYSTELFDAPTIERMAGHLRVLLESATAEPGTPVGRLRLLTDAELTQELVVWNDTARDHDVERLAHEVFAEQANRVPDLIAVECGDRKLTFAELDAAVNQVAHRLVGLGVGPGVPVVLYLDRGVDLVLGMLAAMKAGGAFVSLDPHNPADRVGFVVADTKTPVVLTREGLADTLPVVDAAVVRIDTDPAIAEQSSIAPTTSVKPDDLAYVVYTSGSTGRPKGVMIEHRSLVDLACWYRDRYDITEADAGALLNGIGFDGVVLEVWPNLLAGARVAIPEPEVLDHPVDLVRWIADREVTVSVLVGGRVDTVLDELDRVAHRLRLVITGGDVVRRRPRPEWRLRMVNHYGPSESTVLATGADIEPEPATGLPPIGLPLDNTTAYVLDPHGNPQPVGVPGELHVGGIGLARGYLGRPDLTAERFVADPFVPGGRLYRTGDLVRRLPSGDLEFLGRIDDQVKIRGYRIELAEIEAVLQQHPDVGEAVVTVVEDAPGRKRLVGYVTPDGAEPDSAQVRAFAEQTLPGYMVPSAILVLAEFPNTRRGKLDRSALPVPPLETDTGYAAPEDAVQQTLADIWAQVVGVDRVGVDDNFFTLGGDSILAIQVAAKAHRAGLRLAVRDLFRRQTIRTLSPHVTVEAAVERRSGPVSGPVPLIPVQRLLFDRIDRPETFHQRLVVRLPEAIDVADLRKALAVLVEHHDLLRARVRREDGRTWLHVEPVETHDLVGVSEPDLVNGPIIGAVLDGTELTLTAHHLVVDAVSWRVLVEDLHTALSGGTLPPRTTSFRDWSAKLAAHAEAGGFADELPYWSAVDAVTDVPLDLAGPNTVASGGEVRVSLDAKTTAALLREVPDAYRLEVGDILYAALGRVLAEWTGRDRVLLAVEGHGREDLFEDVDLSRTVGWFTSYSPLALDTAPAGWDALLKSVKEQVRAVPRKGIGHGALRYLTGRVDGPQPLVSFNYLGRVDETRLSLVQDPDGTRTHVLDVVAELRSGRLEFAWQYSANLHREETIAGLAERFRRNLELVVRHCAEPGTGGRTPSDFPLAKLDQSTVDAVVGDGRQVADLYPLTRTQSGMLYDSLMDPGSGIYLSQFTAELDGVADVDRFCAAWQQVVDLNSALRTRLVLDGVDEPLQLVQHQARLTIARHDWRDIPQDQHPAELTRLLDADRRNGLDLTAAPVARVAVIRLSATRVRVVWTTHHLLMDGWSAQLLLVDVFACYADDAPRSRPPFRGYVEWLHEQDPTAAREWWTQALADVTAPTALPYDRTPAPAHRSRSTGSSDFSLSPEVSRRLVEWAQRHHLTANTLIQAAWALLLGRAGGETRVCFGATVSGRPADLPGAEDILGLFINTLPVVTEVDPGRRLVDWLHELQDVQAQARAFEAVSLPQVQEWSPLPADTGLFDSIVVFENYPVYPGAAGSSGLRLVDVSSTEVSGHPLALLAYPGERMTFSVRYDPALFDGGTAERFAHRLEVLLAAMPAGDDHRVADLPMATDAEHRVIEGWATGARHEPLRRLDEVIADLAHARPDVVAVEDGDRSVTYAELDGRANRLAHHLRDLGVGREVVVGVAVERGLDVVVAILAVLKAGGAYVPLDPDFPAARLAGMLDEARPAVVLTTGNVVDRLPASRARVVLLDVERDAVAQRPATPPRHGGDAGDLAYVVYTSGSTGRPKGVAITHRSLHNIVTEACVRYGLAPGGRALQFYTMSFDGGVWEVFTTLASGATLVLARLDPQGQVDDLPGQLRSKRITAVTLPPAVLGILDPEALPDLRSIGVGGDVLPTEVADVWSKDRRLVNIYGPSETALSVTLFPVEHGAGYRTVPLGGPVPNTVLHVLDGRLSPAPVGVTGELYIGGVGLARGYVDRPDLTAERFVAAPSGERLYRTGDQVRWNADGLLEFVGRVDHQVKIRSYRVEPGEVESVLRADAAVGDAVVVAREDASGHKRLVAYVVPPPAAPLPEREELRERVAATLPDYMVPSVFVVLPELPLNTSGKVDRRALPEPGGDDGRPAYVAPRNPTEEALIGIWSEVLSVERVGAEDNFFDLGGDSITSLRLTSRVSRAFGVTVSLRDVFETPTIAGLAESVREKVLASLEESIEGEHRGNPFRA